MQYIPLGKKSPKNAQNNQTLITIFYLSFAIRIVLVLIWYISIDNSIYTFLSSACFCLSYNGSYFCISIAQITGHLFIKAIILKEFKAYCYKTFCCFPWAYSAYKYLYGYFYGHFRTFRPILNFFQQYHCSSLP